MKVSKGFWAVAVIVAVLLIDQIVKIWVKTHMALGEDIEIFSWFHIHFIENKGMAMGIEVIGKLFLSVFRIVASGFIIYYLCQIIRRNFRLPFIICVALVFAGAVGNIVDSIFYGKIFSESTPYDVATLFPPDGGYGTWLHGKVVDMFSFPLFEFTWPDWLPFVGGREFVFFQYIFNVADAAISVGIILIALFYRESLSLSFEKENNYADKTI